MTLLVVDMLSYAIHNSITACGISVGQTLSIHAGT
jgi:hypothetical protein